MPAWHNVDRRLSEAVATLPWPILTTQGIAELRACCL